MSFDIFELVQFLRDERPRYLPEPFAELCLMLQVTVPSFRIAVRLKDWVQPTNFREPTLVFADVDDDKPVHVVLLSSEQSVPVQNCGTVIPDRASVILTSTRGSVSPWFRLRVDGTRGCSCKGCSLPLVLIQ